MYKIILMAALLSVTIAGKAQEDAGKVKKIDFLLDLIVALNLSGIGGESERYTDPLAGGYLGVGTPILKLNDRIRLNGELGFSMQGSGYETMSYEPGGGGYDVMTKGKLRLSYLVMPVTARYEGNKGFFAEAGVQPGFLLGAKDKNDNRELNVKEGFNGFDMGLVLGAGYRKNRIGLGFRFVPGITNINKSGGSYQSVKDRNIRGSVGVLYKLI
jgi:hypothetical protein